MKALGRDVSWVLSAVLLCTAVPSGEDATGPVGLGTHPSQDSHNDPILESDPVQNSAVKASTYAVWGHSLPHGTQHTCLIF